MMREWKIDDRKTLLLHFKAPVSVCPVILSHKCTTEQHSAIIADYCCHSSSFRSCSCVLNTVFYTHCIVPKHIVEFVGNIQFCGHLKTDLFSRAPPQCICASVHLLTTFILLTDFESDLPSEHSFQGFRHDRNFLLIILLSIQN